MKKNDPLFRTMIGGQALIEGIMMRGPDKSAIVVRTPDGLQSKVEEKKQLKDKYKILSIPILRGIAGFGESMKIGVSAISYSADFFPEEEGEPGKFDLWIEKHLGSEKAGKMIMSIALVIGIVMPVLLFILLPTFISGFFDPFIGSGIYRNLIEGGLRMIIFFLFMLIISRMKDMRRTFSYHGAEHKTIHCYEHGDELTIENVRKYPRQHPRCGTSFLLIVMVISILVFSFVTWSNVFVRMALRIALLPLVVGLGYEFNRLVGRYDNFFTRILRAPGMWMQNLTTFEPDDSMIEVGIEALKAVLPDKQGEDRW